MAYNTRQGSGGPQSRARRSNQPIAQNFISGGQLTGPLNQLRPPYTIPSLFEVNGNRFRGAPVQRMNMIQQQPQQQQQIQQQPLLQLQQPPLQQQQQQQPPLQQQQQQQPPPQQQQQQQPPPQQQQQQQQPPPQQQQQQQPAPQQQQQQQQFQATFLQQQSNVPNINQSSSSLSSQIMIQGEIKEESSDAMVADNTIEQNKEKRSLPFKTGKISKKERQRRRNNRLSRILQPKNAVMILNELVKNISYNLTELPQPNQYQFMASVQVADENHVGYGHSKMEAKSSAAEAALKSIVKNRNFNQLTQTNKDVDGDEKMEANDATLPWQHIASFALFKLLNEWGEAPFQANLNPNNNNNTVMDQSDSQDNSMNEVTSVPPQNRPAKRMPDNAIHINPLMLLNQMLPHAQFEELGRSGDPPNISFTFKCTVDGESFIGSGSNKKSAKKVVAFQVCHKILSVQYPPEIYTPNA